MGELLWEKSWGNFGIFYNKVRLIRQVFQEFYQSSTKIRANLGPFYLHQLGGRGRPAAARKNCFLGSQATNKLL